MRLTQSPVRARRNAVICRFILERPFVAAGHCKSVLLRIFLTSKEISGTLVRSRGLEPPRLAALTPQASASTNSATTARHGCPGRPPPSKPRAREQPGAGGEFSGPAPPENLGSLSANRQHWLGGPRAKSDGVPGGGAACDRHPHLDAPSMS